jgi:hypothetical protein
MSHIEAQIESPKHLHETTFKTIKYLQQNVKMIKQKLAQKVAISLGFCIFSKNSPNGRKIAKSGHPGYE